MNIPDMSNQVAIVTGGAQGIGLAVAKRFISMGAVVIIWDMDTEQAEKTATDLGPNAFTYAVDVTDSSGIEGAANQVNEEHGKIDVLIANAGISGLNAPVIDYPVEEWNRVVDINLNGVFNCCRSVLPHMVKSGYGRVVNVASIAGKEGNPNAGAYSASKAGVIALTKTLGKEHASDNISVNCVTPAAARTRIFDQMSQEHIDYMLSKIPRGRFLEVDEAAAMISWLSSAENSFTTGAVFDLSGGRATY
jgi:NAD(P)-dependent dehydrogenase (short-subunit alcohol dehydrogenase family)